MSNAAAPLHGLIAEFANADELLGAVKSTREAGYVAFDAYTPFPVEGMGEALDFRERKLPVITLIAGVVGAAFGLWLQWWINVVDYPIDIGGRPLAAWPAFILPTFEVSILFAAFAAVIGMLVLNRLPRLHHPVFDAPGFSCASRDCFLLCIEATDDCFDDQRTRRFLESLDPARVDEVRSW